MPWTCPRCAKELNNFRGIGGHARKCSITREEMFWSKVDKNAPNGCWHYLGHINRDGYGVIKLDGYYLAHRYAYEKVIGKIPDGLHALHKCNNPRCCNPEHLYLGDDAANAQDKVRAGRSTRGERNHTARLTAAQVLEIRALRGKLKQEDIAAQYGISFSYVYQIWGRHTWRHLAP